MRIIECDQGDDLWYQSRVGVITASMFSTARDYAALDARQAEYVALVRAGEKKSTAAKEAGYSTPPKSEKVARAINGEDIREYSETAKNYAFTLAAERIIGEPLDEGYQNWAMRRGHELEPDARLTHSLMIAAEIERVGFVLTDDGFIGASMDGAIHPNGMSEYKCFLAAAKMRGIIIDRDISSYRDQVQGGMGVCDKTWGHFGLYCPSLAGAGKDLIIHEERRDDAYIEALFADLYRFNDLVEEYRRIILERDIWTPADVDVEATLSATTEEAEALTAAGIFD